MKAYFDNVRKDVPENIHDIFLEKEGTAVITIDMHEGHLSTDPDCCLLYTSDAADEL
mgnify:CR=1 FL=1